MSKWRKRIPILVMTLSVIALCVVALSFATTDEDQKEDYQQQLNAVRSTSQAELLHPDVVAKLEMEAEIQAKIEAEEEGEAPPPKDSTSNLGQINESRPAVQEDLKVNPFKTQPIMPAYTPRTEILWEGFESGSVPPPNWTAIVNNPYTWEIDSYNPYEGTYNASCFYDPALGTQDEWLVSPALDLSQKTAWKLDFAWLGSYYWGVDPYDNYDLEVWISTDGGSTWPTMLWTEPGTEAPWTDWIYYEATVDLSGYSTESNVKLGFRYSGSDGAQWSIDAISVNDEAQPIGRCCYGDPEAPSCEDVTEAECDAMEGYSWDDGLNCEDHPCPTAPENDECANAELISPPFPNTASGTTEGATIDCPGVLDWNAVWYKFDAPNECNDVVIDYCGSPYEIMTIGVVLYAACDDCPNYILNSSIEWLDCEGLTQPKVYWDNLPGPATYYIPVFLGDGVESPFQLTLDVIECPPAPENDDCENAEEIGDVTDQPFSTTAATNDGNGYTSGPNIWYCYTATCNGEATVSLCGSSYDTKLAGYDGCTCDPLGTQLAFNDDFCGLQSEITFDVVESNQYLIEVGGYGSASGDGLLSISCEVTGPSEPGDDCDNPLMVDIPSSLPWCDLDQTTCGRDNSYEDPDDDICMGYYTNGEDIFYEITVSSAVTVNFHLDPKGTSYSGMGLFTSCPPTLTNCIDYETSSSSSPKSMTCVSLDPGTYYLMIDTWSTPYCIPNFDLCIVDTTCEALENDDCANATPVGEVTDLPFSTESATFDGGGTCQSAPNIWYCYTATETGTAIITLCGSGYDTKMAVYDGCTCAPLGTELGCNDDSPCDFMRALQSTVEIPVTAGNSYLVEVGGYSSNTGTGILNIWVEEPCDVVCSGTPEGEPCINDDEEDDTNGGCNSTPPVFGSIDCDETVCGEWNTYLFGASNYRDTDWYTFTLTQFSDVTITAVGEFPIVTGFLEQVIDGGGWDCSNFTGYISPYATADECDTVVVQRLAMAPGDYAIFVGGQVFSGFGCALGTFEYSLSVDCVPAEPTYCEASGGCDEYISNVTFETINNTTGCDNYGDYTALSATVEVGNSYPISITIGNGYSSDTGAVYVDWNQDLDFNDPGEVASLNPGAGVGPYSGTVTVPGDALPGETRMRIRLSWNTDPVPCGTQSYGEVEDYTINVTGGEPAVTYLFEPDPVLVMYKFTIDKDPMPGYIYLSSEAVGGDVNDMTDISLEVRECDVPITATEVITGGYGDLTGDVMKLTFGIKEYIEGEENGSLIYDEIESFFDVYYDLDGVPGQMEGQVTMIGHTSGDLNLDGSVNVVDVTYFVEYLFFGGPAPVIMELADVDGSGGTPNVADLTYLVNYLFNGGPPPMHQ